MDGDRHCVVALAPVGEVRMSGSFRGPGALPSLHAAQGQGRETEG